jgi:dipeptidyl aminopeptidase/acylaminoacyl peptidase
MTTIILRISLWLAVLTISGVIVALGIGTTTPGYTIAAHVYDTERETRLLMLIDTHTQLTQAVPMPHMGRRDVFFSPDGRRMLIPYGVGAQTRLAVFSVREGGLIYESPPDYIDCNPYLSDFSWSSDNDKLLFTCQDTDQRGIHLFDIPPQRTWQISTDEQTNALWSPDSETLMLHSTNAIQTYTLATDTTHDLVSEQTRISAAQWSPDGTQIAYLFNDSLRLVDAQGGEPQIIYSGRFLIPIPSPQWSPDGRWMVIVERNLGQALSVNMDTGEHYVLDGDNLKVDGINRIAWTPSSEHLAIIYTDEDTSALALSNPTGEQVTTISVGYVSTYATAPDSHLLGFAQEDATLSVYDLTQDAMLNQWDIGIMQNMRWLPDNAHVVYVYRNFDNIDQAPLQLYWLDVASDAPHPLLDSRYSVINYTVWSRDDD